MTENHSSQITFHHPDHDGDEQGDKASSATFPFLLHRMLEDASSHGFDGIVSWLPNGNGFKVHDRQSFKEQIMGQYFKSQTRYKSFLRQLNFYGFTRITRGSQKGCLYHEMFQRGDPSLCHAIKRETRVETSRRGDRRRSRGKKTTNKESSTDKQKAIAVERPATEAKQKSPQDISGYTRTQKQNCSTTFSELIAGLRLAWRRSTSTASGGHQTMLNTIATPTTITDRFYFVSQKDDSEERQYPSCPQDPTTQDSGTTNHCFEDSPRDPVTLISLFKDKDCYSEATTAISGGVGFVVEDEDITSEIIATFCF